MTHISDQVFSHLYDRARRISPQFGTELRRIGPIQIQPAKHRSVADHLYRSIVGQQLSTKAAQTIWRRIELAAGTNGTTVAKLLTSEHLQLLRSTGVSGRKARSLIAVRQAADAGLLKTRALAKLSHSDRSQRLCSIWGVGQWTADMIAIFHFLDPDVWPAGDAAATGTLRKWSACEDTVPVAQNFAPYRSILARYMWLSKDTPAQ